MPRRRLRPSIGRSGLAHEPLARGAHERHGLGEEHPHRVAERGRLLLGGPETFISEIAAAVSSTAVLSVSVANCSRWASCTDRPARRTHAVREAGLSGSPPNGKPPKPPSMASL